MRLRSLVGRSGLGSGRSANCGIPGSELLGQQIHSLTLAGVVDIFDADSLWSAQHTRKTAIRNRANGNAKYRLYAHLKANKHRIPSLDPTSGRLLGLRHVFTDLVIQINSELWRHELRSGDPAFALLTNNLALRHREDFKRDLKICGRHPRYVITPAHDLDREEMRFLFGRGIFVPDEHDKQAWAVHLHNAKGQLVKLPEWELYNHQGQVFRRPVGLYDGQRTCLLRGPSGPVIIPSVVSQWPEGDQGFIQLSRLPSADQWQVFDEGENSNGLEQDGQIFPGGRRYPLRRLGGTQPFALIVAEPSDDDTFSAQFDTAAPQPDTPSQQDVEQIASPVNYSGPVSQDRAQPSGSSASHLLRLVGIPLPNISGPNRLSRGDGIKLDGWRLWLDDNGRLAQVVGNSDGLAMVSTDAAQAQLLVRRAGEQDSIIVDELPFRFKVSGQAGRKEAILGAPLHDRHLALLWLGHTEELPLAFRDEPVPGTRWLGRRASGGSDPDLPLGFLDQPGSLVWSHPGILPDALGQLELSRQHLRLTLNAESHRLELAPPERGMPVSSFIFGPGLELLNTLKPGDPPHQLEPGQYMLLGCYLMRFEVVAVADIDQTLVFSNPQATDIDQTLVLAKTQVGLDTSQS